MTLPSLEPVRLGSLPPSTPLPKDFSTVVIEGIAAGGQAGTSSKIENYLGFPTGISGQGLATRAQVQALKFGVLFAISREVIAAVPFEGVHKLTLAGATAF